MKIGAIYVNSWASQVCPVGGPLPERFRPFLNAGGKYTGVQLRSTRHDPEWECTACGHVHEIEEMFS